MRPLVLLLCLVMLPAALSAQVRVRRGLGIHLPKFRKAERSKSTEYRATSAPRTTVRRKAPVPDKSEVDEYFYLTWDSTRKLTYSDFKCAKAPCRPLVTEKETDLLHAIYPNYQAFYNILEKARQADTNSIARREDSVRTLINQKLDSLYVGYNYSVSVDYNIQLSREIDSPAASALVISPVIYNVDDTTFYYNIAALFSKFDSWMIIKSADILHHEQIHFDIFELYARKIRKQWVEALRTSHNEGNPADVTARLALIYETLYKELYKVQADFDEQTSALTAVGESLLQLNAEWDGRVKRQLREFAAFSAAEGTVILR